SLPTSFLTPTAPPATYTLSLHDALPIYGHPRVAGGARREYHPRPAVVALPRLPLADPHRPLLRRLGHDRARFRASRRAPRNRARSEEHTSELQSRGHLVCRLLLEKKKTP